MRSLIRDMLFIFIGYTMLKAGFTGQEIPKYQMIVFGALILFFTIWFLLEKMGILTGRH